MHLHTTHIIRYTITEKHIIKQKKIRMAAYWIVAPCSLAECYHRFRGPCCLHHQGAQMMAAAKTSQTLANVYQTTKR
jgi:hypothetical protein